MSIIDEILGVLSECASVVNRVGDPEIADAYTRAATLITTSLAGSRESDAREAYELLVTRAEDPAVWKEPIVGAALEHLPQRRISYIFQNTRFLASRLPGETGVGSGESRSSGSEMEEDEGEVESGAY